MRKEITLKELREIQLDMMDKIHEFCVSNNIRYSLGGGTLLGAVRHKGYIPWDDDIDIMLPRPDYERFLKEFEGKYECLELQHYKNDDTYYFPFAKVYDSRTVLIENSAISGIYVDVFPIDGLPAEAGLPAYYSRYRKYIIDLGKTNKYYKFQINHNRCMLYIKYLLKRIVYPSKRKTIGRLEKLYNQFTFDSSEYAGAIVGRYAEKEHMKKSIFCKYVKLPFEKHLYNCIADYDAYLTKHYGDYMKLPPKEQQVSNHEYIAYWKES